MSGFVAFVSAGPGDPGLMTLAGAERLRRAQVVLYDDLASGPVLDMAGPEALRVNVGKRAGRPSARQDEVNRLLVHHALTGARVVRLKSGDSGVFGRLEEEIAALDAAGVGFEIVPGVSAASAAAAAAAMPLTRRLTARRVQFVTGADVTGGLPGDLNWAALADADATTVVFMGRRTFPALARGLIAHGLSPETPAMLAEAVGHPEQRLTRTTVAGLARLLGGEGAVSAAPAPGRADAADAAERPARTGGPTADRTAARTGTQTQEPVPTAAPSRRAAGSPVPAPGAAGPPPAGTSPPDAGRIRPGPAGDDTEPDRAPLPALILYGPLAWGTGP